MRNIFLVVLALAAQFATAQKAPRFQQDVETIKSYDKLFTPTSNPILFTGSSSIRKWDNLQQVFGTYNVINRGVGGAVIDDIIYYADDLIFRYKPRQVVLYVGENDLTNEESTADTIFNKTVKLISLIRSKLPTTPIIYIGLKPSPSREQYIEKCKEVNQRVSAFIKKQEHAVFVDVFTPMMANGKPRPELFVGDRLHLNLDGYTIWKKEVEPHLLKD